MRVRPWATSSKRTCPELSTSPSLIQPIPRSGLISVVLASNSTLVPAGPLNFYALVHSLGHGLSSSRLRYFVLLRRNVPVQRGRLNLTRSCSPVHEPPNGAEDYVVEDRQKHLRALLLPRRQVDPGERQPAGPPHPPGQNPQGRTHTRFFRHPPPFPAQKAQT